MVLCSSVEAFPLDFCSEMTDIRFQGRRRENYNSPTLESRLKAFFFNVYVHSEMLDWEGRRNLDGAGKWMVIL